MGNKKKGKILAVVLAGALLGAQIPGMSVAEGAAEETETEAISLSETETEALTVQTGIAAAGSADSELSAKTTEAGDEGTDEDETDSETETSTEETTGAGTTGTSTGETDSETKESTEKTTEAGTAGTEAGETDLKTETSTEKTTGVGPEGTSAGETDPKTEASTEKTPDPDAETETEEAVSDEAVTAVQALIDDLPTVAEVKQMTKDKQNAVYMDAQSAYDYYAELSGEQQEQVAGEKLLELLEYFSGQISAAEDYVAYVTINDGEPVGYLSLDEAFEAVNRETGITARIKILTGTSLRGAHCEIWGNVTLEGEGCTVTDANLSVEEMGTLTIKSGEFDKTSISSYGTVNVEEGSIYVLDPHSGIVSISGGTIKSLYVDGGTVSISGGTIGRLWPSGATLNYIATGISLDKPALPLTDGAAETLTATVTHNPMDIVGKTDPIPVTWTSSDESVATVSGDNKNATVTAVGLGTATITAAAGGKEATCTVTVKNYRTLIKNYDYATSYIYGDTIPEPESKNFTIEGLNEGFSCQWYSGDQTTGGLTGSPVEKPDAVGTYTLVITTEGDADYHGGELRLLVTISDAEYEISIPRSAKAGEDEVSLSTGENFTIGSNGTVRVTVDSGAPEGSVTLTRQDGADASPKITSRLLAGKDGSPLKDGAVVAVFDSYGQLIENTTGKLYFTQPESAEEGTAIPAGYYNGTVTFKISYVKQ